MVVTAYMLYNLFNTSLISFLQYLNSVFLILCDLSNTFFTSNSLCFLITRRWVIQLSSNKTPGQSGSVLPRGECTTFIGKAGTVFRSHFFPTGTVSSLCCIIFEQRSQSIPSKLGDTKIQNVHVSPMYNRLGQNGYTQNINTTKFSNSIINSINKA